MLIFLALTAAILIGVGAASHFLHDQSQETKISQKSSSKNGFQKKKDNKQISQKNKSKRHKNKNIDRTKLKSKLGALDSSSNFTTTSGSNIYNSEDKNINTYLSPVDQEDSNVFGKSSSSSRSISGSSSLKTGLVLTSNQLLGNQISDESKQTMTANAGNGATSSSVAPADKQQLITVSGSMADSAGMALANETIIAKSQNTVVSFTTDSEGNFYTHLPVNTGFSFMDQSGVLLGKVKTSSNNNDQVTNKNGNIVLGKKFFSENSTNAYLQLCSSTIYFSSDEVISGSNNSVTLAGNQEIYPGDVVLADKNSDHQGAITLKVKNVIKRNNQTILSGVTPSTEEVFQEIHTNNSVSLGKETFTPNYNYVESATSPKIFARSLMQISTTYRQSLKFKDIKSAGITLQGLKGEISENPDFEINYSKAQKIKKIDLGLGLKAALSGGISLDSSKTFKLPIGEIFIPTDLPFISLNIPLDIQLTGQISGSIEPEISLSKYVGVEINNDSVKNLSKDSNSNENGITFGTEASDGFTLSAGLAIDPSLNVISDPFAEVDNEIGVKSDINLSTALFDGDLDASEDDSLYSSIDVSKPEFLHDPTFESSLNLFKTGENSFYDENNNAINSVTLPENSSKTLKLPDSWENSNMKILTNGPISVKHSGTALTISAKNSNDTTKTAHLLVIDYLDHDHLIFKKAALTVKIGNFGQVTGQVEDALSKNPINNSSVIFTNKATSAVYKVKTDTNGNYSQDLPIGSYTAEFKADGYKSEINNNINVTDRMVTYNAKLKLVGLDYTDLGNLSGTINDALNNDGLDSVELSFRSGLNNTTGQVINTASTDEDGNYQAKLPGGNYTMEMKKDGYVVGYQNVLAIGHQDSNDQNGILTPNSTDYAYRIVLQWGENPRDLDSHLIGPTSDGNSSFHLYFQNENYQDDGTDAELDVDDTTSYGPETVTIIKEMASGTYSYAVHKYAGEGELANSDATVKVYRGTSLVEQYNVPSQAGNLWKVFQISDGQVQAINQMTTISDQIPTIDELESK